MSRRCERGSGQRWPSLVRGCRVSCRPAVAACSRSCCGCRRQHRHRARHRPARATSSPPSPIRLVAHGVVGNRLWFKLLARVRGVDRSVRAGVYEFPPGVSRLDRCSTSWQSGTRSRPRFTVPEGLTHPRGGGAGRRSSSASPPTRCIAAATRQRRGVGCSGFPVRSFEGFLLPETYSLPPRHHGARAGAGHGGGIQARPGSRSGTPRLDTLGMTRLAAGDVRLDRRGRGAGGRRAGDDRRRVPQPAPDRHGAPGRSHGAVRDLARHRQAEAAALHQGLPVPRRRTTPTSIPACRRARSTRPSLRSIEASLYPAKVPYLYFVAGPTAGTCSRARYDEHLRAIARVRRARRRDVILSVAKDLAGVRSLATLSVLRIRPRRRPRRPPRPGCPTPPPRPLPPAASTAGTSSGRTPPMAMQGLPPPAPRSARTPRRRARRRHRSSCR